jgi:hypothetical protein
VLGTASVDVLLRRTESRTTNDYGKIGNERDFILSHRAEVEPLLRDTCTLEIGATQPIEKVVAALVAIAADIESW